MHLISGKILMPWQPIKTMPFNQKVMVRGEYTVKPPYPHAIMQYIPNWGIEISSQHWNGMVGLTHWKAIEK